MTSFCVYFISALAIFLSSGRSFAAETLEAMAPTEILELTAKGVMADSLTRNIYIHLGVKVKNCDARFALQFAPKWDDGYDPSANTYREVSLPEIGGDRVFRIRDDLKVTAQVKASDPQPGCWQLLEVMWAPYVEKIWKPAEGAKFIVNKEAKRVTADLNDVVVRNWIRFSNDATLDINVASSTVRIKVGIDDPLADNPKIVVKQMGRKFFNDDLNNFK